MGVGKRVFLSYSSADARAVDLVEKVETGLRDDTELKVFVDKRALEPADKYEDRLYDEVSACDVFVFFVSTSTLTPGGFQTSELEWAKRKARRDHTITVLPVMVEDHDLKAFDPFLREEGVQACPYTGALDEAARLVMHAIKKCLGLSGIGIQQLCADMWKVAEIATMYVETRQSKDTGGSRALAEFPAHAQGRAKEIRDPVLRTSIEGNNHTDAAAVARALLPDGFLGSLRLGGRLSASMDVYGQKRLDRQRVHVMHVLSALPRIRDNNSGGISRLGRDDDAATILATMSHNLRKHLLAPPRDGEHPTPPLYGRVVNLLPVMALYHDIGKGLGIENHPNSGYQILREEERELRALLGVPPRDGSPREDRSSSAALAADDDLVLDFFLNYVRYHDLWGNIATGEAGLPLLSLVLDPMRMSRVPKVQLMLMLVANLSDAYGSTPRKDEHGNFLSPKGLKRETLERVHEQWLQLESALDEESSDVGRLWDLLVKVAQRSSEPIKRMFLLLRHADVEVEELDVTRAFRTVANRYEVTQALATVRLAYALQFVGALSEAVEEHRPRPEYTPVKLANHVVDIIGELCLAYGQLIQDNARKNAVTVFELSALRPAAYDGDPQDPKVRFTRALCDSVFEGSRNDWMSRILDLVSVRTTWAR